MLLLRHKKLGRWLQPGGHADPGETSGGAGRLARGARGNGPRLPGAAPDGGPRPLDVDVHEIPARGGEPAHLHLDLRYLVRAPAGARPSPALTEMHDVRFFGWEEAAAHGIDPGLRRALVKARLLCNR